VVRVTGAGIKAAGLPSGAAPPWLMWWQVPNRTGAWRPTAWLGRQDSNLRMSRFDPFPISLRYRKDFAATRPNRITGDFFANELQDGGFCTRMPKYGERNARSFMISCAGNPRSLRSPQCAKANSRKLSARATFMSSRPNKGERYLAFARSFTVSFGCSSMQTWLDARSCVSQRGSDLNRS
jgi:hypothetical protein